MAVILITGANSGIGEAVANQLAKQPNHHIIIAARSPEAGSKVAADLVTAGHSASSVQLDLTSDDSITKAVKQIQDAHGKLDILVNNAGGGFDQVPGLTTREIFTRNFDLNVTGTAILTDALLPLLRKSTAPRVVFVSSRLASISLSCDKTSFWYEYDAKGYSSSKAALNRLVVHYARVLSDARGLVNAVCPGFVKTKLTDFADGGVTPEQGAKKIVEMALLGENGPTATFTSEDGALTW
ncbi:short-chain dehydrogenase [Diaporthe amygdali]|uniref:short-chain dehydrogenase n=1 Tax=Phomopsis amygdali TaxID=1214568 RepID=UPI0022FEB06A|nr:short-chain dehydrogenase [Diaporthe amygdali]KAJ0107662.1 short-chain dehydrogenase [Diaporthe amygdali]